MAKKRQHRSRLTRIVKTFINKAPVPVNEIKDSALVISGSRALFSYKPDDDTDPRLKPGALIDEVKALVSGCGKIGFRSL